MSEYLSQHGEDRELERRFPQINDGFFVEVGALDGRLYSNSYHFELDRGWSGVLVEANPEAAASCRENRPNSVVSAVAVVSPSYPDPFVSFQVVDGFDALSTRKLSWWARRTMRVVDDSREQKLSVRTITVPVSTLDEVLASSGCPSHFEFMTIDIEGYELDALRGMALGTRWYPQVLLIENGSGLVSPRLAWYLGRRGYVYRRSIAVNDWYEYRPASTKRLMIGRSVVCQVHGVLIFTKNSLLSLRRRFPALRRVQDVVDRRHRLD